MNAQNGGIEPAFGEESRLDTTSMSPPPVQIVTSELLTLNEAAKVLRCSKAHLCNVLRGKVASLPPLPHMSLGRRTLIRRAVLQQWIERLEHIAQREVMS